MQPPKIFITGTDTDVGKSHVAKLLLKYFQKKFSCLYIKPFQSGADRDSDSIAKNFPAENIHALQSWQMPAAPDCANFYADKEEKKINDYYQETLLETKKIITENNDKAIIVEGAGGILVPIDSQKMMVDFVAEINIAVILVARTGLGTVNHTLLTVDFLQKKKINLTRILLNDFFASEEKINTYNKQFIAKKTGLKVHRFLEEFPNDFIMDFEDEKS